MTEIMQNKKNYLQRQDVCQSEVDASILMMMTMFWTTNMIFSSYYGITNHRPMKDGTWHLQWWLLSIPISKDQCHCKRDGAAQTQRVGLQFLFWLPLRVNLVQRAKFSSRTKPNF